jgi:anthranilate phosphoribosyltransferase
MMDGDNELKQALRQVVELGLPLTAAQAGAVLESLVDGHALEAGLAALQLAALLGAMAARGETSEELAGFVHVLRARALPLPLTDAERLRLVDTCGTGGDSSGTFNISTGAALVAAATGLASGSGLMVAKHGNRAVTSRSGSADVLEALGIRVDHTPASAAESLRLHRFAFLSAPAMHPAMRAVMPIRRALGVRTAFNLVGPMTNPAGARNQVMGVYAARLVPVVAEALAQLGARHAFVVHGGGGAAGSGLDEIALHAPTLAAEIREGEVTLRTLTPADFGLREAPLEALAGGDARTNAAILARILAGEPGPPRDVVVMNAAAVLLTAGAAPNLLDAARLAHHTLDTGKAQELLAALRSGSSKG